MTPITADTILAEVETKAEAMEIARCRRKTLQAVEQKYGIGSTIASPFADAYNDLVDAIAEKFGKVVIK